MLRKEKIAMRFKELLRDVYSSCGSVFYSKPSNEYILQAAVQIYIAQMKEETIREINLKEENDG
jgi:hypothetical protein